MVYNYLMASTKVYTSIGRIAALYDSALEFTGYKASVEYFVSNLPFSKTDSFTVLDAGCGTGLYSLAVLKRFPNSHVTAFDLNKQMIEQLKNKTEKENFNDRVNIFTADIQDAHSESLGKFDLIITAGVLEYVPQEQVIAILSSHLLPSGYFFNSPVRDTAYGKAVGILYGFVPYSNSKNIQSFEKNGFKLIKTIPLPPYRLPSFKLGHLFRKI